MSVIVIEFITLDGIVTDPDGSGGTPAGGWVFRHGPEAVAGDRFRLGSVLDEGVLLLGRKTWELFSRIWPGRDDLFSARMNAVPKLVATRTLTGTSAWVNSQAVDGDIIDAVKRQRRDVVIMGSVSIVHTLMANDLIDEYRLLTFPTILGTGERLFPAGGPADLELVSAGQAGAAVLARYRGRHDDRALPGPIRGQRHVAPASAPRPVPAAYPVRGSPPRTSSNTRPRSRRSGPVIAPFSRQLRRRYAAPAAPNRHAGHRRLWPAPSCPAGLRAGRGASPRAAGAGICGAGFVLAQEFEGVMT